MSDTDYNNSGLPVRTAADGTDERVHVKVVDGTISPAVNQMKVDSDNAAKVLTTGHDPGGVNRTLRTSEIGALTPDGVYNAANNSKPGNTGIIASSRSAVPGDATQTQRITAAAPTDSSNTIPLDVAIRDSSGNAWTPANPVPVTIVDPAASLTDIFSEVDALAVAINATANMDYAVITGHTAHLSKVICSSSAKGRFELQTSVDGTTFVRLMVKYGTAANPNVEFDLGGRTYALAFGTGAKFRIAFKNTDNAIQDAHTLFIGYQS